MFMNYFNDWKTIVKFNLFKITNLNLLNMFKTYFIQIKTTRIFACKNV